jgi:hypothetical protein
LSVKSGLFGLKRGNPTTTSLPTYPGRQEPTYESADEEVPRKSLDERVADEKPRRWLSHGHGKGSPQGNALENSGRANRSHSQPPPVVALPKIHIVNVQESAGGRMVTMDPSVYSDIKTEVNAASARANGPVHVVPIFLQPMVHDKSPTIEGPKRLAKPQPQKKASMSSLQVARIDSISQFEEPWTPTISPSLPQSPQNQLVPMRPQSQYLEPYRPSLPPRPNQQITQWSMQPSRQPQSLSQGPPQQYQQYPSYPNQYRHPMHRMVTRSQPGLREMFIKTSTNCLLDMVHPSLNCPCGIRHTSYLHAPCIHCRDMRCAGLY